MLSWLILCSALFTGTYVWAQNFALIGQAAEAGNPCGNHILTMDRLIGGPPSKENYWNGKIYLEQFKNLPEARITLRLTAPATVTLDEEDGRLLTDNEAFHIEFYKKDNGTFRARFRVQGRPKQDFPNLAGLSLNNVDICPNLTEWKPSLLGSGNFGTVDLVNRTNESGPDSPCGRRIIQHQGLITNGFPSQEGDWPWHAALYHIESLISSYKCGGTLISSKVVISASHCISENGNVLVPERVLIKLGQHNRLIGGPNTQEFQVFKIISHKDFNSGDLRNDIALLKLATEVIFNNYIQPACLWDRSTTDLNSVINRNGIVIGWGFNERDVLSEILTQGVMPVVSLTTCLNSNRKFFGNFLSDMNFCAGFRNGTSVCSGDSGGGMFFKENEIYSLRGIVSLGVSRDDKNLCNPKQYVIFTDVAKYLNWIETNMV